MRYKPARNQVHFVATRKVTLYTPLSTLKTLFCQIDKAKIGISCCEKSLVLAGIHFNPYREDV